MEDLLHISYQEWEERINSNISQRNESWYFFKKVEMALPEEYKIMLLMNCVYVKMDVMPRGFSSYFKKLVIEESEKSKVARKEENLKMLDSVNHMEGIELLDNDEFITVYRGINNGSNSSIGGIFGANKDLKHGISYSFNQLIAQWFAIRTQADECSVITAKVHIDDVFSINLDRNESEIIIKPPYLGGKLHDVKIEPIIPDIKIMKQFDKNIRIS